MRSKKTNMKQVASKSMVHAGFLLGSIQTPEERDEMFLKKII
jgi:hypothetical protein